MNGITFDWYTGKYVDVHVYVCLYTNHSRFTKNICYDYIRYIYITLRNINGWNYVCLCAYIDTNYS